MLIIFITPNTSVSPEAIKAYTPPVKMPVMIASTTMIPMVIYFPGIEICRRRRTPRRITQAHPDRLGRERERGTGAACQAGRYPSPRACLARGRRNAMASLASETQERSSTGHLGYLTPVDLSATGPGTL